MKKSGAETIHTESQGVKICIIVSAILSLTISSILSWMYWGMWNKSVEFNDHSMKTSSVELNYYNKCDTVDSEFPLDTKWQSVFIFNTMLYFALTLFSIFIFLGTWFWLFRLAGFIGHCFGTLLHLAGIIITAVRLYSPDGKECAKVSKVYNDDGDSFQSDSEKLQSLFIAQTTLFLFYNCCVQCSACCGSVNFCFWQQQ